MHLPAALAPHRVPATVDAVLDAVHNVRRRWDRPEEPSIELRAILVTEELWRLGFAIVPSRLVLAYRLAVLTAIITASIVIAHLVSGREPSTLLISGFCMLLGLALGASLMAWVKPRCDR